MKDKSISTLRNILLSSASVVTTCILPINELCGQESNKINFIESEKEINRIEDSIRIEDSDSTNLNKIYFSQLVKILGAGVRIEHRFKESNIGIYSSAIVGDYKFNGNIHYKNYTINNLIISLGAIYYINGDSDNIKPYFLFGAKLRLYNKSYAKEEFSFNPIPGTFEEGSHPLLPEVGLGFNVGRYGWGVRFDIDIYDGLPAPRNCVIDLRYGLGSHYSKGSMACKPRRGNRHK
jgi:hypothetical protein